VKHDSVVLIGENLSFFCLNMSHFEIDLLVEVDHSYMLVLNMFYSISLQNVSHYQRVFQQ